MTIEHCRPQLLHRRSGYVMLVVIAVSVTVITILSMLATISLRRGLQAADAQHELQQRWGSLTLQRELLSRAAKVFEQREELAARLTPGKPPPPHLRAALTLRGVTFDIMLGDEDAKLNLNALYHQVGQQRTEIAAAALLDPTARRTLRLLPSAPSSSFESRASRRVAAEDDAEIEDVPIPDPFRSWGEVFDLPNLTSLAGGDAALPNVTTGMTCWGSGQLNFRRASDQAILEVAGAIVQDGGARRLLSRYRRSPTATLAVILQTEVSGTRERVQLAELLSESSSNFSIWIDASVEGRRSVRYFIVNRTDDEGVIRQSRFVH